MLCVISRPSFFVRPLLITSRKAIAYRSKASWNPSINILTCNAIKEQGLRNTRWRQQFPNQNDVCFWERHLYSSMKKPNIQALTLHKHIRVRNREVIKTFLSIPKPLNPLQVWGDVGCLSQRFRPQAGPWTDGQSITGLTHLHSLWYELYFVF